MSDFLLDENNDLIIKDGDFAVGDSEEKDIELLMTSFKGDWKEHPLAGAGLQQFLKGREYTAAVREAKKQLQEDGYDVFDVEVQGHNILIDAKRNNNE